MRKKISKIKPFELRKVTSRPDLGDAYSYVGANVSNFGAALFLFIAEDVHNDVHKRVSNGPDSPSFPSTKMPFERKFKLVIKTDDYEKEVDLGNLSFTFPLFDVFNDGRIVIVASRCEWRGANDFDLNGIIFDPKTGKTTKFLAGDGIQSLAVDNSNCIFISYFDEGVFGNFGWNSPGPQGLGAGGLNCFNDKGEILWQFNKHAIDGEFISDCYAMNVSESAAHIFYYTDFSLCKVDSDFTRTYWKTKLSGCHFFAVDDESILFSGQYDDEASRFYFSSKLDGKLSEPILVEANIENSNFNKTGQTVGRGGTIHHFNEDGWFKASIETLRE